MPEVSCATPRRDDAASVSPPIRQSALTGIDRVLAKQLFDAEELVVLRPAVGAAEGAGLDLAAIRRRDELNIQP